MNGVICAFTCSFFTVLAQVLWKMGLTGMNGQSKVDTVFLLLGNMRIWSGLVMYGVATLVWLYALSRFELSYIYPLMGITYILSLLAGAFIFDEAVGWSKIVGVLFIVLGIVFISRG